MIFNVINLNNFRKYLLKSTMIKTPSSFGINILGKVVNSEKNRKIFEKNIRAVSEDDEMYKSILYQVITDINSGKDRKIILNDIKLSKVVWNHEEFHSIKNSVDEQDDFVENPFEVEEGVLDCGKCGCKKVFSYSKQCRGSDEPMSTFATCVNCKNTWVYSG